MKMFQNVLALCALVVLSACVGDNSKEQRDADEFNNSISNPTNASGISDVNFREMTDDETRSIYEVFTGKEFGHGRLILRTDQSDRSGLYFFVMFDTYRRNILKGTLVKLYVQTVLSHIVYKFTYIVPENTTLLRELVLGITGKDSKKVCEKVQAWKIEVLSPEDKLITQQQSWLWSVENPSKLEKQ